MSLYNNHSKPKTILDTIDLECVLFLDIETVPLVERFEDLDERFQELWTQKSLKYNPTQQDISVESLYFDKAAIHAEFGKVICISVGFFKKMQGDTEPKFRVKSFYGQDEKQLLMDFKQLLDSYYNDCYKHYMCAHNGIEFDFPYLGRRMMINSVQLPSLLNVSGTKSWNNKWLVDTMDLWRFGDYKEKTSLNLLAACFGIQTPKDDISGKDVARVYYLDNDLERIKEYCQKDVRTTAQIFRCFMGLLPIPDTDVLYL